MKQYDYTVGLLNKTTVYVGHDHHEYTTTNFVAVCSGDKLEFEGNYWYLWNRGVLITSGLISGLKGRKARRDVNICGDLYDFLEYNYTAYDEINI